MDSVSEIQAPCGARDQNPGDEPHTHWDHAPHTSSKGWFTSEVNRLDISARVLGASPGTSSGGSTLSVRRFGRMREWRFS